MNMDLTVLTNSLKIINKLCDSRTVKVYSLGGMLSLNSMSFLGRSTLQCLEMFHYDKAFISCAAISMEYGLMDANEHQAYVRELASNHAKRVYLIADHTKFNGSSFMQFGKHIKIKGIIVDEPLDEKWQRYFEKKEIALYCGCN